jgi:hypothetical protein
MQKSCECDAVIDIPIALSRGHPEHRAVSLYCFWRFGIYKCNGTHAWRRIAA